MTALYLGIQTQRMAMCLETMVEQTAPKAKSCLDGWAVKLSTITNEETISNSVPKCFVYPNPAKNILTY